MVESNLPMELMGVVAVWGTGGRRAGSGHRVRDDGQEETPRVSVFVTSLRQQLLTTLAP